MSGSNGPKSLPPVSPTAPRVGQSAIADWLDENYGELTQQPYAQFMLAAAELLNELGDLGFRLEAKR